MNIAELGKSPHADPLVKTILEHDLARHIVELDAYGFTVIPPEKLGTSPGFAERLRAAILNTYQKRHNVEIDDWQTADLPAPNEMAWQLVDEDDVITEAVLNPVVLAMARWHCGQSAILGGTSSIIKPPHEKNYLAIHNDTHGVPPPRPPTPTWSTPVGFSPTTHRARMAPPSSSLARTAGAGRRPRTRPTSGNGRARSGSTSPSRSRPRPGRSPSGAATPGTAR